MQQRQLEVNINQTIFDVCLQAFGTLEALIFILIDNDNLKLDEMPTTPVMLYSEIAAEFIDERTRKALSNIKIIST